MTIEENEQLIKDFPFLRCRNVFTGKYIYEDGMNESTWLGAVPDGWRDIFIDMCKEINIEYNKLTDEQKEMFQIVEVKEKYGALRVYCKSYTKEVGYIIDKYMRLSAEVCVNCGKPAKWYTTGWIEPVCDKCKNACPDLNYAPIDEVEK